MMKARLVLVASSAIILLATFAACTGGGGGAMSPPPPPPGPSPSPVIAGTMQLATGSYPVFTENPAGNATVVFSCGCTDQAGTATTSNTGAFTLVADSTPTPAAPDPVYTIVPGRNYLVVAATAGGAEAWDLQFAGRSQARNQYLNGSNMSDVYTTAVSLYVYDFSYQGDTAFDNWNFNQIKAWYKVLNGTTGSPNAAEQKLLNDIAGAGNTTLYPAAPTWDHDHTTNATIASDLTGVKASGDKAIPTPCPGTGCTNTPNP
jgi:hypothetical protein